LGRKQVNEAACDIEKEKTLKMLSKGTGCGRKKGPAERHGPQGIASPKVGRRGLGEDSKREKNRGKSRRKSALGKGRVIGCRGGGDVEEKQKMRNCGIN